MPTTQEIIDAVNAYANRPPRARTAPGWMGLLHRSSWPPEAAAARAVHEAGRAALALIQDWPIVEHRAEGACVMQAPDGTLVLYYCEGESVQGGFVLRERLTTDLRTHTRRESHE
jgi:hypothetical protein